MHMLLNTIHGFIILALVAVFAYNMYKEIKDLDVVAESIEVKSNSTLVPPALTLCATQPGYSFEVSYYGDKVANEVFLKTFQQDDPALTSISTLVQTCWTLTSPDPNYFIRKDPKYPNVAALQLNFTRLIAGTYDADDADSTSNATLIYLNIFDPLTVDTLFDYSRFLILNADGNRVVTFSRTQSINVDNKVKNDIEYGIIEEFRAPEWSVPGVEERSYIKFRAVSFDIVVKREVRKVTPLDIFRDSITLLSALSTVYILAMGTGKFSPWGFIHRMLGYYPIEHIKYKGADVPSDPHKEGTHDVSEPQLEERLSVYLQRFKRAKYDQV